MYLRSLLLFIFMFMHKLLLYLTKGLVGPENLYDFKI